MIQVCNEEVSINYEGKLRTYKNYLLSNFFEKFVQKNFGSEDNFGMTVIYGIFNDDADITIDEATLFEVPNFDDLDEIVPLNAYKYNSNYNVINTDLSTTYNENEVTHIYRYRIYRIENDILEEQNSEYFGRKISYLLFGNLSEIYAILDIRDEEIIYNSTANIDVFRRDKIITKGKFYSKSVDYPLHLSCFMETKNNSVITTQIKNIGFSYNYKNITKMIPIEKLSVDTDENTISITSDEEINKWQIIPSRALYSESSLYPLKENYELSNSENTSRLLFPMKNQNLFRKYPLKAYGKYKYVIIDYETNIGHYYMTYPIDFYGKIKIDIKYERREF